MNCENTADLGFIDGAAAAAHLRAGAEASNSLFWDTLDAARKAKGLNLEQAAILLQADAGRLPDLLEAAAEVKQAIYGKRVVMFAPLYISNYCVNRCTYCGYSQDSGILRKRLTEAEIEGETQALIDMGHKRIALETGEDPVHCSLDYVLDSIAAIYRTGSGGNRIRRINVNMAASDVAAYERLKQAQIGTYILFQETYHRPTYEKVHASGPKANYHYHLHAMDRSMAAGLDDVGLGVLFGLHDFRAEVLALLAHAEHLESSCGVGPHTISMPRLRPARGMDRKDFPDPVSDGQFQLITAVLRLALPFAGLILSTREPASLRDKLIHYGISQISAGSCTGVGGYRDESGQNTAQFETVDDRSCDQMVAELTEGGILPSFCTACYRQNRTGERFMRLAKAGNIQNVCEPNALLTLQEFLEDYASIDVKEQAAPHVRTHLESMASPSVRRLTEQGLQKIEGGERDMRL